MPWVTKDDACVCRVIPPGAGLPEPTEVRALNPATHNTQLLCSLRSTHLHMADFRETDLNLPRRLRTTREISSLHCVPRPCWRGPGPYPTGFEKHLWPNPERSSKAEVHKGSPGVLHGGSFCLGSLPEEGRKAVQVWLPCPCCVAITHTATPFLASILHFNPPAPHVFMLPQ